MFDPATNPLIPLPRNHCPHTRRPPTLAPAAPHNCTTAALPDLNPHLPSSFVKGRASKTSGEAVARRIDRRRLLWPHCAVALPSSPAAGAYPRLSALRAPQRFLESLSARVSPSQRSKVVALDSTPSLELVNAAGETRCRGREERRSRAAGEACRRCLPLPRGRHCPAPVLHRPDLLQLDLLCGSDNLSSLSLSLSGAEEEPPADAAVWSGHERHWVRPVPWEEDALGPMFFNVAAIVVATFWCIHSPSSGSVLHKCFLAGFARILNQLRAAHLYLQ